MTSLATCSSLKEFRPALALALLFAVPPVAAGADEVTVKLDTEATEIHFTVGATLHRVEGEAQLRVGEVRFDPRGGFAAGEVLVDARSLATGNAKRDRKMHRQVLASETHPDVILRLSSIHPAVNLAGSCTVVVEGELVLQGQAHAVSVPAAVEVDGERFTAELKLEIPYVEWGLDDPSSFVLRVAKVVEVTVVARGTLVSAR